MRTPLAALPLFAALALTACRTAAPVTPAAPAAEATFQPKSPLDEIAEGYVKLVLAVGRHDAAYVDAYYGPAQWKAEAEEGVPAPLAELRVEAKSLRRRIAQLPVPKGDLLRLRRHYLDRQLEAVQAYLSILSGETMSFDAQSQALYDATAPSYDLEAEFGPVLARLDAALPGEGPLVDRYQAFRSRYLIPADKVQSVFEAAIAECRRRTAAHVALPADEQFTLELVKDKPWGGYNWYQGHDRSLIQVNVSLPIGIDRAIDIACHEGYPGHHVYNVLIEDHLVRERGFVEMTVYPLFSPQSLIAEGTANYGIEVAFPGDARVRFEREVLYPLAGLDPATAERWDEVRELTERLDYAGNEIARRYVDGVIDADTATALLKKWLLMDEDRARLRVRFVDTYKSYVINYNVGQDLVRRYVEARGGTEDAPERRWEVFSDLLASPRLPGELRAATATR